jgi:threonine/homoserine/homoserine lactone efflux protein
LTITLSQITLYAGAVLILFAVPGPVWAGIMARAISGGFNAAWPLAVGVVIGDILWPLLAIKGVAWIVSLYADFLTPLRWLGSAIFVWLGVQLIRHADRGISTDSRLTRPGMWSGFTAGVLVIIGNPKAILFYMGVLPGFFDLSQINRWDIIAICLVSAIIPLTGNLMLALLLAQVRQLLSSPVALRRTNQIAGALLIAVGIAIALM